MAAARRGRGSVRWSPFAEGQVAGDGSGGLLFASGGRGRQRDAALVDLDVPAT